MASDAAIEGVSGAAGAVMALLATYPLLTVRVAASVTDRACGLTGCCKQVSTLRALKHKNEEAASELRGYSYGSSIHEIKEVPCAAAEALQLLCLTAVLAAHHQRWLDLPVHRPEACCAGHSSVPGGLLLLLLCPPPGRCGTVPCLWRGRPAALPSAVAPAPVHALLSCASSRPCRRCCVQLLFATGRPCASASLAVHHQVPGAACASTAVPRLHRVQHHRPCAQARAKRRRGGVERAAGAVPLPQSDGKSEDIGVAASLVVASIAGCANVLLTNPVWVVVTQMQASHKYRASSAASDIGGGSSNSSSSSRPPANAWAIAKELYSEKGILGLWQVRPTRHPHSVECAIGSTHTPRPSDKLARSRAQVGSIVWCFLVGYEHTEVVAGVVT
jgi:hypothetical protein